MSDVSANSARYQGFMPMRDFPAAKNAVYRSSIANTGMPYAQSGALQSPAVAITTPQGGRQIYSYPETSLYNADGKKSSSGLNIYVFGQAGPGAPNTINNTYGNPLSPIANTSISGSGTEKAEKSEKKEDKKHKKKVELTDEYLKTLENFLKSRDKTVRKQGIEDLIMRFEEDKERRDDESLTALLNIALQDPDSVNQLMALSIISSGNAKGDDNTIEMLKALTKSDRMYGKTAQTASRALLKASQTLKAV